MNGTPNTVWTEIDESLAKALVTLNVPHQAGKVGTNRPIRWAHVRRLADDMLAGRFHSNHQGIALAGPKNQEVLVDGQHRLHAILLAAKQDPMVKVALPITHFVDPRSMDVVDTGLRRTPGDALGRQGVTHSATVAAALRLIDMYDNVDWDPRAWRERKLTAAELVDMYEKNPEITKADELAVNIKKTLSGSAAVAALYLFGRERPDIDLDPFIHGIRTGADLPERSALLALRDAGNNFLRKDRHRDPILMLGLTVRAFNFWVVNDGRTQLRFRPDSAPEFPRVTTMPWTDR